jgi:hypothetical protein
MQLLVSVADPLEAQAAVAGGADIVDAKDAANGPLGAVVPRTLRAITAAVGAARPTSAALGEPGDAAAAALAARVARDAGVGFVKMGFRDSPSSAELRRRAAAAQRAAGAAQLILVAYADWDQVGTPAPELVLEVALAVRAAGVLIDTAIKGPTLFDYLPGDRAREWIARLHGAGLLAAVAGSLGPLELPTARDTGADIAGVRGSACVGGRTGRISRGRVAAVSAVMRGARPAPSIGAPA